MQHLCGKPIAREVLAIAKRALLMSLLFSSDMLMLIIACRRHRAIAKKRPLVCAEKQSTDEIWS